MMSWKNEYLSKKAVRFIHLLYEYAPARPYYTRIKFE